MVNLAEKLQPRFIYTIEKKTAGTIATDFKGMVAKATLAPLLSTELAAVADRFVDLVKRRNRLMHAHPVTYRGEQRLNYWSPKTAATFLWEPEDIKALIVDIESLAIDGNRLYYDSRMP